MGRQVYLGGYEHAEHAAEAYDVAALKCKGFKVKTNFDIGRQAAWQLPRQVMHASKSSSTVCSFSVNGNCCALPCNDALFNKHLHGRML